MKEIITSFIVLLSLTACFETEHKSTSETVPQKGESGSNGKDGAAGQKGDKGDVGPKGDKGEKGDVGPKGDKGDTGPRGATGPQGATGPAGSTNNVITRVYNTVSQQHPNAYTIITFVDQNGDFDYQVNERVLGKAYVANTCNCVNQPTKPKEPCDKE